MSDFVPPIGLVDLGYSRITNLTYPVPLAAPQGTELAVIVPENGSVRWRADGVAPTKDAGSIIWGTTSFEWSGSLSAIRFINMDGNTAALNVTYFGVADSEDDLFIVTNNAISTLDEPITTLSTTLFLKPGTGVLFPSPGAGQYTCCTLAKNGIYEIVRVTARDGDELTVVRGQEGTTAIAWAKGALIQNLLTAGEISQLLQKAELTSALILNKLAVTAGPAGTALTSNGPDNALSWEYPMASQVYPPPGMVDLGYSQVTSPNTPTPLNAPAGSKVVSINPQNGNVRWRADGIAPDEDTGSIIWGTSAFDWGGDMAAFEFIAMNGSSGLIVNLQFYGVAP